MSKRKLPAPPVLPPPVFTGADVDRMRALALTVVSYQRYATSHDAEDRSYWLPRDAIGADGKTLIRWYEAGDSGTHYATPGWEPWHDGMFGGHYDTMGAALGWIERARAIRAGTATHF